jgi:ATP-dependent exoDNAse (exonuclease V) beta subunit
MDVLHTATEGKPCSPSHALEVFVSLIDADETSELVSRRVESDVDAVQIMTIHSAKGLQFPCVVVADLWKPSTTLRGAPVFYNQNQRVVDIVHGLSDPTDASKTAAKNAVLEAQKAEMSRVMYVALTRTMYHLSVLVVDNAQSVLSTMVPNMPQKRDIASVTKLKNYQAVQANSRLRHQKTIGHHLPLDDLSLLFPGLCLDQRPREGISLNPEEKKMGIKGSSTRQVFFNNVKVPVENMLSDRENGFKKIPYRNAAAA